jgi:hypothetical protein
MSLGLSRPEAPRGVSRICPSRVQLETSYLVGEKTLSFNRPSEAELERLGSKIPVSHTERPVCHLRGANSVVLRQNAE